MAGASGIVWWEACVVPYARTSRVAGCHLGLLYNRRVYAEIATTLAAVRRRSARADGVERTRARRTGVGYARLG